MAIRIGKFTRSDPRSWLELQGEYDLWKASKLHGIRYTGKCEGFVMAEGALEKRLLENIWRLADQVKASQVKRGALKK